MYFNKILSKHNNLTVLDYLETTRILKIKYIIYTSILLFIILILNLLTTTTSLVIFLKIYCLLYFINLLIILFYDIQYTFTYDSIIDIPDNSFEKSVKFNMIERINEVNENIKTTGNLFIIISIIYFIFLITNIVKEYVF